MHGPYARSFAAGCLGSIQNGFAPVRFGRGLLSLMAELRLFFFLLPMEFQSLERDFKAACRRVRLQAVDEGAKAESGGFCD